MKLPHHLSFVPGLLRLAMPIAAQALMMTILNLVDTVMVGRLGEVEIAAIALGNQIFFLLMLFLLGVGSGGAVFTAQYWGKGDVAGVRKALGLSLRVALTGALVWSYPKSVDTSVKHSVLLKGVEHGTRETGNPVQPGV